MQHIREEAWEAALDVGRKEGRKETVVAIINLLNEMGTTQIDIRQKLMEKLELSETQVTEFMDMFEE